MGIDLTECLRWIAWCWLVVAGLAIAVWALWADRSRGRLRCPRCWYDLGGARLWRCSECGHRATTERSLRRTRRHWRLAMAGACFLALGGAAPLVANVGSRWPRRVPTTVLILGLSMFEDAQRNDGWKREALEELLCRRIGVEPALDGNRSDLKGWQWRLLLRRAMRQVPTWPGPRRPRGKWPTVLATGLGRGAVHRAGLVGEFMRRYPGQVVISVPVRCPQGKPVPFGIAATTPFAQPRLRIISVTADGEPLAWRWPGDGGESLGARGLLRIPNGRDDLVLRFDVEMTLPVTDRTTGSCTELPLGTRTIAVGFQRGGSLGPSIVALPDPTLDDYVLHRYDLLQGRGVRDPKWPICGGRRWPVVIAEKLADELEIELGDELEAGEIAAMSLSEARERYARVSRMLQRCRLDDQTKKRLWREWRRVRVRVRELKSQARD
ncbi:MAG: hypothetical protein ACYTAQ_02605 [Planctomycetota bacterium]|jgi:hypothetical protein